ncbi:leucine-rich repeat domain-containing protein [Streptomyces apricus]|uniref:Leucine-rich repeat domain-containing protein n=1 Tax=Streptomyces apricus TaxID=1828112 RepID=A0A5B0A5Q1_9ACTN|nr:leucine-rich repeat domain-containing protein [Streptomyces apricus]
MEPLADVPQHTCRIDHLETFHGLPVLTFPQFSDLRPLPDDPSSVAWRLQCHYSQDEDLAYMDRFLASVPLEEVRALVLGAPWYGNEDDGAEAVEELCSLAPRLSALEALFLGDLVAEECEVSWIEQSDLTPLLEAYPRLRELGVRGAEKLVWPVVRHEGLRTLRFESGGLPAAVVRDVAASDLPALECLDLWLGVEDYGGDATVEDLWPLLTGERLPSLRHLGLQNSPSANEIAAAVAQAPVVARLESLALSMGTLDEEGAMALLSGQPLTHLRRLDLRANYLDDAMMLRLWETLEPAGVRVDMSEQKTDERDEDGRYTSVAE